MSSDVPPTPSQAFPFTGVTTLLFAFVFLIGPFALFFGFLSGDLLILQPGTYIGYVLLFGAPLFLALWSFLRAPIIQIRNRKMEPLAERYGELVDTVAGWEIFSKLEPPPVLLRIPGNSVDVFAFGTWRHRYIAVSDGALNLWSDPETLRAVLLHEAGHLASGDTWRSRLTLYYAEWVMIGFLFGSTSVLGSYVTGAFNIMGAFIFVLQGIGILSAIISILLSVRLIFRTREFGADFFAITQLGTSAPLIKAFGNLLSTKGFIVRDDANAFVGEGIGNRLTKLLGFHPSLSRRLILVQDPIALAYETSALSLVAGFTVGILATFQGDTTTFPLLVACVLLLGPPILISLVNRFSTGNVYRDSQLLARNIMFFVTGAAIAMSVLIVSNTLFQVDGLRVVGELRYKIAYALDILLVILVIMPLGLFAILLLTWLVAKHTLRALVTS